VSGGSGKLIDGRPPKGNLEVFWGKSDSRVDDDDDHSASDEHGPVVDSDDSSSSTQCQKHVANKDQEGLSDDTSEESEKTIWNSFARMQYSSRTLHVGFYDDSDDDCSDYSEDEKTLHTRATKAIEKHNKNAARRIERHGEYFNQGYVPTEAEKSEIQKLASELISSSSVVIRRPSFGKELCGYELAQIVLDPIKGARHEFIRYRGASVMLKKGPIIFRSAGNNFLSFGTGMDEAKELILFNHSFLVASISNDGDSRRDPSKDAPTKRKSMMHAMRGILKFTAPSTTPWHVSKTVDFCEQLTKVTAIVDLSLSNFSHMSHDDSDYEELEDIKNGFRIVLPKKSWTFSCVTVEDKEAWIDALSIVVMKVKGNTCDALGNVSTLRYEIMKIDAFSAVVCGDEEMLRRAISTSKMPLMTPDGNGYSLCHYAVMKNNPNCLKVLLDAGADPNCKDVLGKAPGCYARSKEVVDMLLDNGANEDDLPDLWDTSDFSDRTNNSSAIGRVFSASNLRKLVPN